MTIQRSTIIRGPAIVKFDGAVFYTEGDITATPDIETFEIPTSVFGKVDERVSNILIDIEFTPAGEWANLAKMFPHASPSIGDSIFGATDKNLVIHTKAGKELTYKAAALTQMPSIILSTTKTLLGPMKFTCIGADNEAWSAAAHRVAIADLAFSDTSFDPANILTQPYAVAWGSTPPWDAIETEEGITIETDMQLEPVPTDSFGTVDMTLAGLSVSARFKPVGVNEQQITDLMKIQGTGAARGSSLNANSNDLNIIGTGVYVRIYKASPNGGGLAFGNATLRAGELEFVATRSFTAGAADPLFYVGTGAPV